MQVMAKLGRPPKYDSPEKMQVVIDEYFEQNKGNPTISGLALYIGFEDRHAMYMYEEKIEFRNTIKKLRARMVEWYEQNVFENTAGAIFMLKNFGYSDRQDLNVSGNVSIKPIEWSGDE